MNDAMHDRLTAITNARASSMGGMMAVDGLIASMPKPMQAPGLQPGCTPPAASPGRRAPRECGDLPFLIKRDGTWLYRGSPIGRRELVCLFSSVLKREADGSFWLETDRKSVV